jgi:hypothetical protein
LDATSLPSDGLVIDTDQPSDLAIGSIRTVSDQATNSRPLLRACKRLRRDRGTLERALIRERDRVEL